VVNNKPKEGKKEISRRLGVTTL